MTKLSESAIALFENNNTKRNKILVDRAEELRLNVIDCAINYSRNPNNESKILLDMAEYGHKIILDLINDFNNI